MKRELQSFNDMAKMLYVTAIDGTLKQHDIDNLDYLYQKIKNRINK